MRIYIIEDHRYKSVTTYLGTISKPGLIYFYGKHGTAKATAIKNSSARIGELFHKYIKADCKGKRLKFKKKPPLQLRRLIKQYHTWKKKYKFKPIKNEIVVWSKKHGYAGTLDCLGKIFIWGDWHYIFIDWKSGGKYKEDILQVVAYFFAYLECKKNTRKYNTALCAIVNFEKKIPGGKASMSMSRGQKSERLFKIFKYMCKVSDWR